MLLTRIEVISGSRTGAVFEPVHPIVSVGRNSDNDFVLPEAKIAEHHLRFRIGIDNVILECELAAFSTVVRRGSVRLVVGESQRRVLLEPNDVVELGDENGEPRVALRLTFAPEEAFEPQVVATRPIGQWEPPASTNRFSEAIAVLSAAERTLLTTTRLDQVYEAVLDAALRVVARATHATLILRDDPLDTANQTGNETGFIPVMTRIREKDGTIVAKPDGVPVVRSIFRKVIRERSSVLAVDAASAGLGSESLLGSNIQSTVAVPLWRNDEIIGVLELDSRARPAMFEKTDLDLVSIMASTASLAIYNSRLIERLSLLERQSRQENAFWRQRERHRGSAVELVGDSPAMRHLLSQIDRVAQTRATVLIEGETGVGKELVAASVHAHSPRHDRLFVAQNCATLPDNLLESELFGHKKGSFTGASEDKKGLFEIADGGTLFLDEIGEIPLALQAKLLRALQEGEIRPVGSSRPRHVDARIIVASNRNLEEEVREGRFREDLFYRLNVFPLKVPPLRERREDVPLLANYFLTRYVREFGKSISTLSAAALELLTAYAWPGNVRELQNEIQRLVIQAEPGGTIDVGLVSAKLHRRADSPIPAPATLGTLKATLEEIERKLVEQALREHGNNKTSTAKALGITREGLHKKLRQLKL
jgi:transcriptional regulator with GAF, ATPase, and Fis domain